MRFLGAYLVLALLLQAGCCERSTFEKISSAHSGVFFQNTLLESSELNVLTYEYFYNGSGVGVGDFNNDGLEDLFFTSNMGSSRIYLNRGDFRFDDITDQSGIATEGKWANGVSIIDINQDGHQDIYVCFSGPYASERRANELYINNGDGTFTEMAEAYGLADTSHSVQAAFFDFDLDGYLDMYLLNNMTDDTGPNVIRRKRADGQMLNTDKLYRNNGDNTFTDVSAAAGITIEGYGLGVSIGDFNEDGWPDIYVSNDYLSNDLLYINQRDGTFRDVAATVFKHTSYSAMGNDVGDFDNDGRLDVVTLDMLPPDNYRQKMMFGKTLHERFRSEVLYGYAPQFMRNTLQWNRGLNADSLPRFSEIAFLAGIGATDWSWSSLWVDVDNDGWKDLLITNGYPKDITNRDFVDYKSGLLAGAGVDTENWRVLLGEAIKDLEGAFVSNFLFQNQQGLRFNDVSAKSGLAESAYSSGAVYADLDNDGHLDLVIANTGSAAFIYRNSQSDSYPGNFIKIRLKGPENNLDGIGTKVFLYSGLGVQYHEHYLTRGYQSSVSPTAHFGLGGDSKVDSVVVVWPDRQVQVIKDPTINQLVGIDYAPNTTINPFQVNRNWGYVFEPLVDSLLGVQYRHKETYFSDFNVQPLLPHKLSQLGPGICVADVDGNGLEDFFVGGAFRQSGEIYFQQWDGTFTKQTLDSGDAFEEDMGALFFDVDGDGDLDLYVVSGGNEFQAGSPYYQDRLYVNEGGVFRLDAEVLPVSPVSGSCVVAADFDQDGDVDLFVGGRQSPQYYPRPGVSKLLENRKGKLVDVTDERAPGLKEIGMVTSAIWSDIDNDGWKDLVVVGEWMPVSVFKNDQGFLRNITEELGLTPTRGWWNSIQGADVTNNGYTDFILGNLGLNSRYTTSSDASLQVHMADFDNNGTEEGIISHVIDGVRYPIHPRDDLFSIIPSFKRQFPDYQSYALATMDDLMDGMKKEKITTLSVDTFRSGVLINESGRTFSFRALPYEAQISPIFGIHVDDLDEDGAVDLILSGNNQGVEVLTGQYDASYGAVLKGDGQGNFRYLPSNLFLEGDAKAVASLYHEKSRRTMYLFTNTDGKLDLRAGSILERPYSFPKGSEGGYAVIHHVNGTDRKREFYRGSGYLTQFSNRLTASDSLLRIDFFDSTGRLIGSSP